MRLLRLAVLGILFAAPLGAQEYDIIIRGGRVLDGSGQPERVADVAIANGRVAKVGDLGAATARRTIEAAGKYVTPGFIDMHSHADWGFGEPELNAARNNITQGITTVVVGQDGRSAWRVGETIADAIGTWQRQGLAENAILLVGAGSVRREVMGDTNRAPTTAELDRMRALVRQAMDGGAWGISTGLSYVPGRYATTEEVIALTREVKPYDGFYISHLRDQGDGLMQSVEETIRISRETGVPVVHSHFKSSQKRNFGKAKAAMDRIAQARTEGVQAWVDVYPWATSSDGIEVDLIPQAAMQMATPPLDPSLATAVRAMSNDQLVALILAGNPWIRRTTTARWLRARPRAELVSTAVNTMTMVLRRADFEANRGALAAALATPGKGDSMRAIIKRGIERQVPEQYVIDHAADPRVEGKTLTEAAAIMGVDVVEAAIRLQEMDAKVTHFHMSEPDVEAILGYDFTAISTDGILPYFGVGPEHPRSYGSFTRLIGHYVRERNAITMPHAVRAASGLAADIIGLKDRGYLKEGQAADVVVFDPQRIDACATYARPHCYSTGIEYLLVNGVPTIDAGHVTGLLGGAILTPKRVLPTGGVATGN